MISLRVGMLLLLQSLLDKLVCGLEYLLASDHFSLQRATSHAQVKCTHHVHLGLQRKFQTQHSNHKDVVCAIYFWYLTLWQAEYLQVVRSRVLCAACAP